MVRNSLKGLPVNNPKGNIYAKDLALSQEFDCGINELPLTLVLSWFEQKAIVILLTLFALGVKGIYTGPTAPAFLTENLLKIIQDEFDMRAISTPEQDLKTILAA